jgi:hypothetical protein
MIGRRPRAKERSEEDSTSTGRALTPLEREDST